VTEESASLADALRDRYTIERELGRGGMAVVFLARDLRHERPVALKVLRPDVAPVLGAERFQREIRLAARLQHPHVLTVLDSGEAAGCLWFTMPYVEGESLRQRLGREGALPLADALRIAREVADGLDYAHRHGVIHRDVKPENILLSGGHALVADFGIARALAADTGETTRVAEPQLTDTGLVIGTPTYMSPEQISGDHALGPATDVFSLGVVLYEMLAGVAPFTGPTAQSVIAKHFSGEIPSLRKARPEVPEAIDAAVIKALARDQSERYATAGELAKALEGTGQAPLRLRRLLVPLALAVAAVVAVLGWWRVRPSADVAPRRVAVLPFQNVGAAEDEYFADGVADAVRGKLSGLPGLQVIASSSSDQYRATAKTPQEIGRELGAQYLLVGKVRWNKAGSGESSRVQVSPELIETATATTRWQQPFDAPLADVFQVQGEIASRVASALDVAIERGAREHLAGRPTRSLTAYDAFLRGEQLSHRAGITDPQLLRQAAAAYEEALRQDSTFALAWAQLSRIHSLLYVNGPRPPAEREAARHAAGRALALDPKLPQAYFAQAYYLSAVLRQHAQALDVVTRGRQVAPRDAELLAMAGLAEQQLGRWDDAIAHFSEARSLDPRSHATLRRLSRALTWLRRYPEARAVSEEALRLTGASADVFDTKVASYLGQGDLAGAKAALRDPPPDLAPVHRIVHLSWYFNLFWLLEPDELQTMLRATPEDFDGDPGIRALTFAQAYDVLGRVAEKRAYADTARIEMQRTLAANPEDGIMHGSLANAFALLGDREASRREAELALRLEPVATNHMTGPFVDHSLILADIALGDDDAALDRIATLLARPYWLSAAWIRLDPAFAPLRKHPRFDQVVPPPPPPPPPPQP
jgi:serine/threonine-protein kinase